MSYSCAAIHCLNKRCDGDVRFHKFPLHDKHLCEKWLQATKRHNVIPKDHSYLCEQHFTDADYQFDHFEGSGMKKLRPDAVPSVFRTTPMLGKRRKYGTSKYPFGLNYGGGNATSNDKSRPDSEGEESGSDSGRSSCDSSSAASSRKCSKDEQAAAKSDVRPVLMKRDSDSGNDTKPCSVETSLIIVKEDVWLNTFNDMSYDEETGDAKPVNHNNLSTKSGNLIMVKIRQEYAGGDEMNNNDAENCSPVAEKLRRPVKRGVSMRAKLVERTGSLKKRSSSVLRRSNSLNIDHDIKCLVEESREKRWNKSVRPDRKIVRSASIRRKNE